MRADTTGANAPNLPVPATEDAGEARRRSPRPRPTRATCGAMRKPRRPPRRRPRARRTSGAERRRVPRAAAPAGSEFSDAVAIQLPVRAADAIRKPYFIFGDKDLPDQPVVRRPRAKQTPELWLGRGSDALTLGARGAHARPARYDKGEWTVVFKRDCAAAARWPSRKAASCPIAFSVWDGSNRERGNKRALSTWWTVYLSPATALAAGRDGAMGGPRARCGARFHRLGAAALATPRQQHERRHDVQGNLRSRR